MARRIDANVASRPEAAKRRRFLRRRLAVFAGVAVVAAAGIGVATRIPRRDPPSARGPSARQPYSIGEVTCTFVDGSRQTHDYATDTNSAGRILRTEIRYPAAKTAQSASPASGGPFPVIVFAHGFDVTPDTYAPLLDEWVRAGFVVVAPIFPATNATAVAQDGGSSASEQDIVNQPADMTFVTRGVIADSRVRSGSCPRLYRLVRPAEIGLAGQSDGGDTVAMLAFDARYDAHAGITIRAVAVMSGEEWYFAPNQPDPYTGHPAAPSLLVVQSETDSCNPPQYSVKLYNDDANADKWFLRILNAPHLAPYDGHDASAFSVVARTTTRYFELEVAHQSSGARLRSVGNSEPSVARISNAPRAPAIPQRAQSSAACYAS